jgi:hypothetical protein
MNGAEGRRKVKNYEKQLKFHIQIANCAYSQLASLLLAPKFFILLVYFLFFIVLSQFY